MGVDIYGRNPQIKSEKPEINYQTASEGDRKAYWEILDEWEEENPGYYFRSNWWAWRPIVAIIDAACIKADVDIDTSQWHENGGDGPQTQEECTAIANAIEDMLNTPNSPWKQDDDVLYLCLGAWCTLDGKFLDKDMQLELDEAHPLGTVLTSSVVASNGTMVRPAHGTSMSMMKEFITFLRNCGGFQIF